MRIAFVVHDFSRAFGHGRYVAELAARFAAGTGPLANLVGVAILVSAGLSLWLMLPISALLFVTAGYASAFLFANAHDQSARKVHVQAIKQGVA
jgi:hypothetical protein